MLGLLDRARAEPRDIYDLWYLLKHAGINAGFLLRHEVALRSCSTSDGTICVTR